MDVPVFQEPDLEHPWYLVRADKSWTAYRDQEAAEAHAEAIGADHIIATLSLPG